MSRSRYLWLLVAQQCLSAGAVGTSGRAESFGLPKGPAQDGPKVLPGSVFPPCPERGHRIHYQFVKQTSEPPGRAPDQTE